jgi:hypothetical protein
LDGCAEEDRGERNKYDGGSVVAARGHVGI